LKTAVLPIKSAFSPTNTGVSSYYFSSDFDFTFTIRGCRKPCAASAVRATADSSERSQAWLCLAMPEIRKRFADLGISAVPTNVAGFNNFVKEQVAVLGPAVKGAGVNL